MQAGAADLRLPSTVSVACRDARGAAQNALQAHEALARLLRRSPQEYAAAAGRRQSTDGQPAELQRALTSESVAAAWQRSARAADYAPAAPPAAHPAAATAGGRRDSGGLRRMEQQVETLGGTLQQVNSHLRREELEKRQLHDEMAGLHAGFATLRVEQDLHGRALQDQGAELAARLAAQEEERQSERRDVERRLRESEERLTLRQREHDEELRQLREEKEVLKEWLDRGVAECRRVGGEVRALRERAEEGERERQQLQADKERAEQLLVQTTSELQDALQLLQAERQHAATLRDEQDERLRRLSADLAASGNENASLKQQLDRLDQEFTRVSGEAARQLARAGEHEEAAAEVRSLARGLERVAHALATLEAAAAADGADADDDAFGAVDPPPPEAGSPGYTAGGDDTYDCRAAARAARSALAAAGDSHLALRTLWRRRTREHAQRVAALRAEHSAERERLTELARQGEERLREQCSVERQVGDARSAELEAQLSSLSDAHVAAQQQIDQLRARLEVAAERETRAALQAAADPQPPTPPQKQQSVPQQNEQDATLQQLRERAEEAERRAGRAKEKGRRVKEQLRLARAESERLAGERSSLEQEVLRLRFALSGVRWGPAEEPAAAAALHRPPPPPAPPPPQQQQQQQGGGASAWRDWQHQQLRNQPGGGGGSPPPLPWTPAAAPRGGR